MVDYGNFVCVLRIDAVWMASGTIQWSLVFVPVNEVLRGPVRPRTVILPRVPCARLVEQRTTRVVDAVIVDRMEL